MNIVSFTRTRLVIKKMELNDIEFDVPKDLVGTRGKFKVKEGLIVFNRKKEELEVNVPSSIIHLISEIKSYSISSNMFFSIASLKGSNTIQFSLN